MPQQPQSNGLRVTSGGPTVGEDGEVLITRTDTGLQISVDGGAVEPIGGGGSGTVESVTGNVVDDTDPDNPVITAAPVWTLIEVTDENAQDIDIDFDGDAYASIEVKGRVLNNNASLSTMTIQPNEGTTNQASQDIEGVGTTGSGGAVSATATATLIAGYAPAGGLGTFRFEMFTAVGTKRDYTGSYQTINSSNAITTGSFISGLWNDSATAITSIRLHSDRADGFKIGSRVWYRLVPQAA